jgi:hypothetical protein
MANRALMFIHARIATFASNIYFQILAAVSFLFLWLTCWVMLVSCPLWVDTVDKVG